MNAKLFAVLLAGTTVCIASVARAHDDEDRRFSGNPRFTTRAITPFAIEGLTGDRAGNLYTTGRQTDTTKKCPIWRFARDGSRVTVAFIPNPTGCNPSGITFDAEGNLYVADGAGTGTEWKVAPDAKGCDSDDSTAPACASIPTATAFATGVPGTNGIAFDRDGNLWTGDGTTGVGRVWRIAPAGGVCEPSFSGCDEVFRIQAMANVRDPVASGGVANVGRDNRSLPPGTINAARTATNTAGSQPLVANGVAFTPHGDLYVADTARGAIWKVEFDRHGNVKSPMGCDSTFTANTLCLDAVLVAHPYLEGTDGIALDRAGNIWNAANERNAIVVVTRQGRQVFEFFRNPVNTTTGLRNAAETADGNKHILELPTSPFLQGNRLCDAQSDGDRRDISPRAAGEINAGGPVGARGKISCL
ncbi:MAG: SMP-30/gluconolactonase/LRE family protein, partial [Betaproteobacteria bacterium]|nr:SMP-30/gluconolactonase/LRE family protein [Betaproteobacteria bacterium]